jgi:hypothetical protein
LFTALARYFFKPGGRGVAVLEDVGSIPYKGMGVFVTFFDSFHQFPETDHLPGSGSLVQQFVLKSFDMKVLESMTRTLLDSHTPTVINEPAPVKLLKGTLTHGSLESLSKQVF